MRKILWVILLFSAYIWVVTSGNDGFLLDQAKTVYKAFVSWFDDAELDFNLKTHKSAKKRSRRWD